MTEKKRVDSLDGLRAIAVLGVLLFHIDARLLPGGYVGVDVFFVLSGFLVSRIIVSRSKKDFTFLSFISNRVRRLMPASLCLIALTMIVVNFAFVESAVVRLRPAALCSLVPLSNFFSAFFKPHGYFNDAANADPLLHMWSLALEWQFYLLWPFVCVFLQDRPHLRNFVLLPFAFLSLTVSELLVHVGEPFISYAYYMLPTRCYALLFGAWLAMENKYLVLDGEPPSSAWLVIGANFLSTLSVAVIVGSMAVMSSQTVFPGFAAAPACFATLLFIFLHRTSTVCGNLLSWKLLSGLGVISYSVYLYHFPLISILRLGGYDYGSHVFVLIAFSVILGAISYFMVEQPGMQTAFSPQKTIFLLWALPALVVAVALFLFPVFFVPATAGVSHATVLRAAATNVSAANGTSVAVGDGGLSRSRYIPPRTRHVLCEIDGNPALSRLDITKKLGPNATLIWPKESCLAGAKVADAASKPKVLFIGDSFGIGYTGMIDGFAAPLNVTYWTLSKQGEVPEVRPFSSILSTIVLQEASSLSGIVIGAHWSRAYFHLDGSIEGAFALVDALLAKNSNVRILIVGSTPTFEDRRYKCPLTCPSKLQAAVPGSKAFLSCNAGHSELSNPYAYVNRVMRQFADSRARVSFWDPFVLFCNDGTCRQYDDDGSCMFRDGVHLSYDTGLAASRQFVRKHGIPAEFQSIFGKDVYHDAAEKKMMRLLEYYSSGGKVTQDDFKS